MRVPGNLTNGKSSGASEKEYVLAGRLANRTLILRARLFSNFVGKNIPVSLNSGVHVVL